MTLGAIGSMTSLLPTRSLLPPAPASTDVATVAPSAATAPAAPLPSPAPTAAPASSTNVDDVFDLRVRIEVRESRGSGEPERVRGQHGRQHFQGFKQRIESHLLNAARGLDLSGDQQAAFTKLVEQFGSDLQSAWNEFRQAKQQGTTATGTDAYKSLVDSLKSALDTFFNGFGSVLSPAATTPPATTPPATTDPAAATTTDAAAAATTAATTGAVLPADLGLSIPLPTPDVTNAVQGNTATTTAATTSSVTANDGATANAIPEGTLSALRAEVDRIFESFTRWIDKREQQSAAHAHRGHRDHDVNGAENDGDDDDAQAAAPSTDAAPASSPTAGTAVREASFSISFDFRASFYASYGTNA